MIYLVRIYVLVLTVAWSFEENLLQGVTNT